MGGGSTGAGPVQVITQLQCQLEELLALQHCWQQVSGFGARRVAGRGRNSLGGLGPSRGWDCGCHHHHQILCPASGQAAAAPVSTGKVVAET